MWPWLSTACLARAGFFRRSIAAIPSAPPPSSLPSERARTGLARERESVGGARRFLPRGAGAAAGRGWRRGRAGGVGGGERPESPGAAAPGFPRRPWERHGKQFPSLPRRPQPAPAELSLLLKGALLEHTSPVVTSPRSLLPCPWHPLVNGLFDSCHWLFSPPGSQTPGGEGPGVSGEEKPGCVGWGRGQVVVSSLAPGNPPTPLYSVVEWGWNHPVNPGRMRPQSRYTRIK